MPYSVEVVLVETSGPDSEAGMPIERLPLDYDTIDKAQAAGMARLKELKRPGGTAFFRIVNERGEPV